jgi:phosphatidyl-myo-inositol dimannoside synthase
VSDETVIVQSSNQRSVAGSSEHSLDILMLISDAYGSYGGISQYNMDLIDAFEGIESVESVTALPRIAQPPFGVLPRKLKFDVSGVGSIALYVFSALRVGLFGKRPDVIICGHINLLPLARTISKIRNIPLILFVYGIDVWDPPSRSLAARSALKVDLVVSISRVTLDRMRSWCPVPDSRTALLPNAIDLSRYGTGEKSEDLIEKYNLKGKKVIMTVGRMVSYERMKGFDEIINAMPVLLEKDPNIIYMIVGKGTDRERLEGLVSDLGLEESVIFTGMVDEERKADHYRLADVFAMPSTGEGFGFVFLEAMACGVPVVAGRFDGGFEAIREGELGLAVDPRDQAALVDAVLAQMSAPHGIQAGLEFYSFSSFRNRLKCIIENLIGGRS